MRSVTPIFIFSLPRSGSTLLQRILGAHPEVGTASEPWILLPLCYTQAAKGVYAEYNHRGYVRAVNDFWDVLPNGKADYDEALRSFVSTLYRRASSGDETYFLDKTPRYHLIASEIMELFPGGKFIFLWRNPLSVVASLLTMDESAKWNLPHYKIDLYKGLECLVQAQEASTSAYRVQYADLITDPASTVKELCSYLEIQYREDLLSNFGDVQLSGSLGDRTGTKKYTSISEGPINKWEGVLNTPVRKIWMKRYLAWIGAEKLEVMGYDYENTIYMLNRIPVRFKYTLSDSLGVIKGGIRVWLEPYIVKSKFENIVDENKIYVNT